ncbi:hypothetical protein LTR84_003566 [Exophiala bonariae]|uniref:Kynurenine formamidase n=1 Tax=Exophiala bonariae TaxID=1690606 RepID=A0AAV9N7K0_9EURO|nr:hypothetical protein LTR84_003566 [Exophiala bonariae]
MADKSGSQTLWDSVPWQEWLDTPPSADDPSPTKPVGWHKPCVPYLHGANSLQTLDVWIPSPSHSKSHPTTSSALPDDTQLLSRTGVWIVYIHGGAWRDATIKAASFAPTLHHILKSSDPATAKIAGYASLDYTLSGGEAGEASRNARHPDHIIDVLRGIGFLQDIVGFKDNYIILGHSCGATLLFQALMDRERWRIPRVVVAGEEHRSENAALSKSASPSPRSIIKPSVAIGLDGLYDLPGLIEDPGEKHSRWIPEYEAFTRDAFGDDKETWFDVSPVSVKDWVREWGRNDGMVVLVQSHDDTLVPYRQLTGFHESLKPAMDAGLEVFELPATGDHDALWETGDQIARIIVDVLIEYLDKIDRSARPAKS